MNNNQLQTLERIESLLLNNKKIFNIEDLCAYTGLSKSWVYKKTASGLIPHYKPSNKILIFKKDEIDEWLLKNPVRLMDDIEQEAINYVTGKTWRGA
ncbi:helix-turn-helix domain-containing protein [Pedobacter sp. UBA4863]|uniref:helix-turn-helix transcriptional regulator n=1 Tax=Pedobacter sp. UBA4863 TaxID=1947060 RepID=UPI0025D931E6|nr:helix-turn-helix domain-containing protein [Pedobacter sp. UBA4863]